MSRANGIESSGGTPPFVGPFPERLEPIHEGSERDVLSRTVRKGSNKYRRTAQQADAFARSSIATEPRSLLGRRLRTDSDDHGVLSKHRRKTCTPRAVWQAITSYRDRARQDVAPGGRFAHGAPTTQTLTANRGTQRPLRRDAGFTPFAIRRNCLPDRALIATLVLPF